MDVAPFRPRPDANRDTACRGTSGVLVCAFRQAQPPCPTKCEDDDWRYKHHVARRHSGPQVYMCPSVMMSPRDYARRQPDYSSGGGNLGFTLLKGSACRQHTGVRCKIFSKTNLFSHRNVVPLHDAESSDLRACRYCEIWLRQGGVLR